MKKLIIALSAGLMAIGAAAPAAAVVNVRQLNQDRRIDAGVRSGKLTPAEASKLHAEQRAIEREKARMKARHGGHLTKRDERIIHQRQDAANRRILHLKDNGRRAPSKKVLGAKVF